MHRTGRGSCGAAPSRRASCRLSRPVSLPRRRCQRRPVTLYPSPQRWHLSSAPRSMYTDWLSSPSVWNRLDLQGSRGESARTTAVSALLTASVPSGFPSPSWRRLKLPTMVIHAIG
eukprot:440341-Hanusia_phi.AAC.2